MADDKELQATVRGIEERDERRTRAAEAASAAFVTLCDVVTKLAAAALAEAEKEKKR